MATNGYLKNSQANGNGDVRMNGHYGKIEEVRNTKHTRRHKRTLKASIVSIFARLLLWYTIITTAFRCPVSLVKLTDTSPQICKPYIQLRSYLTPYVEPYYDTYLAHHVDTARPYVDTFNQKLYTPAAIFTQHNYHIYGAPRVQQLQSYTQREWDRTVKPQLDVARSKAIDQYNAYLQPHVGTLTDSVRPYYDDIRDIAIEQYYSTLLPSYNLVLPYVQQGYAFGHLYTTNIIIPYVRWSEATVRGFLTRIIWPRLRVLYGDSVEPQLMRISERLGRYKDGKSLEAAVDAVDRLANLDVQPTYTVTDRYSSPTAPASSSESIVSWVAQSVTVADETVAPSSTASSEKASYDPEETKEKIANDLRKWQEKFATAADKGSDDLEERVSEITAAQIDRQANGVGRALVIELEETSTSALKAVKSRIIHIVQDVPQDPTEALLESALDEAIEAIRSAGAIVKTKAMNVRNWKQKYDEETYSLVHAAADSTLDVIDNIRDLGLQEIGMRWAWMDGVTYKDWQKYHQLKKTWDEWRNEVQARAFEHAGLQEAKSQGQKQEDDAMEVARDAAFELARLKKVAKWKLWAEDSTDDFSDNKVPERVFRAAKSIESKLSEASEVILGTQQGSIESVSSKASESIANMSSRLSSAVVGTNTDTPERVASEASKAIVASNGSIKSLSSIISKSVESGVSAAISSAESVASIASEQGHGAVMGVSSVLVPLHDAVESMHSGASDKASSVEAKVLSAVGGTRDPVNSAASMASEKVTSVAAKASPAIVGSEEPIDSVKSVVGNKAHSVVSKASSAVAGSQDTVESISSAAADVISQASSAVVGSQGTAESMTSVASEYAQGVVSAAHKKIEDATEAIKGHPPPAASQASSSLNSISAAVSEAIDNPKKVWGGAAAQKVSARTPILDDLFDDEDESYSDKIHRLVSDAGYRASDITKAINEVLGGATMTQGSVESATSIAREQYEKAFSAVSSALYGAPQGPGESLSSIASENYAAAVTAASYAIYGTPTPILSSLSSQAEASYSAALKAAQAEYEKASSAISSQIGKATKTKPVHEEMLLSAERVYSGSIAAASQKWQAVLKAVVPTQAPLESVSSLAASRLSEGLSIASAQYTSAKIAAGLQPTPATQHYLDEARKRYYEGIGMAHARYSEFLEEASSAVYGTPTPAYESVLSAAQSQYSAAIDVASSNLQSAGDAVDATSRFNEAYAAATAALFGASAKASEAIYGSPQGAVESFVSQISQKADSIASVASSTVIGTQTPWTESVASQASQNWESLVARASEQVYGQPTPFTQSLYNQAGEYGAQATEAAAAQYASIQALLSELVIGKEADFTESVYARFSSAYHTDVPGVISQASSYASVAYDSASSVVSSVFTPPPAVEAIIDQANDQLNAAVDALSVQIYGTEKNYLEKATDAAGSAYAAAQTQASEAIYGTEAAYVEKAQASFADVAASAQSAISIAIYGTPTGAVESATNAAGAAYESVQSVVNENIKQAGEVAGDSYEAARAKISSAIYGPEVGAIESAQNRVATAVESARARLDELAKAGGEQAQKARESVVEMVSSVAEAAAGVTGRVKDEL
ncbi:hypothetical protein EJ05DRAFT_499316 [Pseudovirgaria hyperparasitica]|uniref:Transcription factor hoxa13 n=1 Tax=Pseudovirgaria hyperparasitica TaxID=470096 RepID=A0A6A6W8A8_9PEZI|nr:uncharacterized protein EJ05DRAFT_499316 [Pseudovirgaria hyperparasitica]KAF2758883.1 hypothetical protein EJ05DRAFT_499316 [Pseudovirgaria hyperparasitica]